MRGVCARALPLALSLPAAVPFLLLPCDDVACPLVGESPFTSYTPSTQSGEAADDALAALLRTLLAVQFAVHLACAGAAVLVRPSFATGAYDLAVLGGAGVSVAAAVGVSRALQP